MSSFSGQSFNHEESPVVSQRTSPEGARRGSSGTPRSGRRRRRVYFGAPPPKALALSGWALVPLRAFLGLTFCFAGLQKLANPNFFNANSPSGIQAQLIASIRTSPLHQLLGHLLGLAVPIGIMIALAELAVGLGTVLGLWTRVAAAGGMLLSVTLFLTVSFHTSPYYTGADVVFVFAWIPLVLAGSGGVLSLDGLIAARVAGEYDLGSPTVVPIRFALVQQVCGHYENDSCRAQSGRRCNVHGCPFLSAERPGRRRAAFGKRPRRCRSSDRCRWRCHCSRCRGRRRRRRRDGGRVGSSSRRHDEPSKRERHAPASSAGCVECSGLWPDDHRAGVGGTDPDAPPGTPIGLASDVPVGGSASFTDPKSGDPGLVLQLSKGRFVAYDAICPHAGCTVGYSSAAKLIVCPCHGSEFDPNTGAVVNPPAQHGLSSIQVAVDASGELVIDG